MMRRDARGYESDSLIGAKEVRFLFQWLRKNSTSSSSARLKKEDRRYEHPERRGKLCSIVVAIFACKANQAHLRSSPLYGRIPLERYGG